MKVQTNSPVAKLHAQAKHNLKAGRAAEGAALLRQAIELFPSSGDLHAELAAALAQAGNFDAASTQYKKACRLAPRQPHIHYAYAQLLMQMNHPAEAERYYRKVSAMAPNEGGIVADIGLCLQRQKKTDEAEQAFNHALALSPENLQALYGLGQIHDARDEAPKAFGYFKKAKEIQSKDAMARALSPRAMPDVINRFRKLVASGEAGNWTAPPMPADAPNLVFLVGFPRSGTTLLDQILSGHPDIEVAEEKTGLAAAGNHLIATKKNTVPEALTALTAEEIQNLRKIYFASLRSMGFKLQPGSTFIDKLPLNLIYAPFIHRLFPDAKFILALRHPCDSVLSCHMQPFNLNEAMMHFLDLENGARFYDMAFGAWNEAAKILKLKVHTVRYENVISDLKAEVEAALKFLEREWHEGMENFDVTAQSRRVRTPSAGQVNQKIYTRAKGRWHKYREYMGKVPEILRPWVEKFGYEIE